MSVGSTFFRRFFLFQRFGLNFENHFIYFKRIPFQSVHRTTDTISRNSSVHRIMSLENLKVAELKNRLKDIGMAQNGEKGTLIFRLRLHEKCVAKGLLAADDNGNIFIVGAISILQIHLMRFNVD